MQRKTKPAADHDPGLPAASGRGLMVVRGAARRARLWAVRAASLLLLLAGLPLGSPAAAQTPAALAAPAAPAATATASASACLAPALARLSVGFTMTHFTVAPAASLVCGGGVQAGLPVTGAGNILLHYQEPGTALAVRAALRAMAAQGATVLRDLLWYYHTEDSLMAARAPHSPIGLAPATNGRLPDQIIRNLRALIGDARNAGYRRVYVVIGL